ncbi:MAG: glycoside hydrolase family 9 protein [Fermentimonas sp.]|nr:glycoside hydrolase family 9 protein [Fermentimonas sp.]
MSNYFSTSLHSIITLILFISMISCVNKQNKNNANEASIGSIHLNSIGYLPNHKKEITVSSEAKTFELKQTSDNKTVYQGNTVGPNYQENVDQNLWIADFPDFSEIGEYYIQLDNGERSENFLINNNLYDVPFATVMNSFYLLRCGTAVTAEHNGDIFHHESCHHNDAYGDYIGYPGVIIDGTGGWHDAGDYGKYVVNAGITMGVLLFTWEHLQENIIESSYRIPESRVVGGGEEDEDEDEDDNLLPHYLKELKWEMDWLLKMPYPDGSGRVSHKLTRTNFSAFIMPEEDNEKRFFTEWSSAATASFAAVAAQASRIFAPYDTEYANKCLAAAKLSFNYLIDNPEEKPFIQGDFKTGGYQTRDYDDKLWAAAELWETTGEDKYLEYFEKAVAEIDFKSDENWDWGNVTNLALFAYILSEKKGKTPNVISSIRENIIKTADTITRKSQSDMYGRPLDLYYWGCNGTVARQTLNLFVANKLQQNNTYREVARNAVDHLFGRNYYNRSFVTGLGHNPPMNPHDRRSGADKIVAPWPGYLVGGGHSATDWVDLEDDYARNEVAINWQAPLVFALAWMLK